MQKDFEDLKNFVKGSEIDEFIERYELKKIHLDLVERLMLLFIASFGLIAALAWDDTFKAIFVKIFGGISTIVDKGLYALIISLVATLLTVRLNTIVKVRKIKIEERRIARAARKAERDHRDEATEL